MNTILSLFEDALAFVTNPDARKVSQFKYPSGQPMSVREAKKQGLLETN